MNIFQRLNEVRRKVPYIKKEKIVKGAGYLAVTHDDVTAAVREHLVENGVMIVPTLVSSRIVDTQMTTASGVPIIRYEATYEISFVNCDAPEDRVSMKIESHAMDQGDKAPGKAISYATKYAMLKLFSIETGEEDEERLPAKSTKPGSITAPIKPTDGAWDDVPKERHEVLHRIGSGVIDYFSAGKPEAAFTYLKEQTLSNEEKTAVWTMWDSKMRSTLKKLGEAEKEIEKKEPANA